MADEQEQPDTGEWLDDGLSDASETGLTVQGGELQTKPLPDKYALKLDMWGKRRGKDLAETPAMKEFGMSEEDCADMHGMAFEWDPELKEECADQDKLQFLQMLQQNQDYKALHADTCMDETAAELASLHFSQQFSALRKRREEEQAKQGKGKNKKNQDPAEQELEKEMQAMGAANQAVKAAAEEVQELRDMQDALGVGKEEGGNGGMSVQQVRKTFDSVKNNRQLREICELAGRYRRLARAKQRSKLTHGYDDMIGIDMGNDVSRLIPTELAALGHPILKMDAMRRFVERQMMQREYRGIEKVAKGPIIVAIDESGSMGGDKIVHAKALGLTMAWVARHQNRWCGLVSWSDHSKVRWLALPPNKWPTAQVMEWLAKFYGGGTHLPVEKMPEIYDKLGAQKGKTDVIIITDGETGPIAPQSLVNFQAWKEQVTAKLIGISIQCNAEVLKSISDEFYLIDSLGLDNDAVERVVSV